MSDFVTPEPERLTLHDGKFIDIKKRLNHGETEDMYAKWAPFVEAGSGKAPLLQRREVRTSKVEAYLLGWSLTNDQGKPVAMTSEMSEADRVATIRGLSPERFDEIHAAIEAHETKMNAERAAQKKIPDGPPVDAATSSSPSPVTGPLSGSVN